MYSKRHKSEQPPTTLEKNDIEELHYICPIDNLRSVLTKGILSHKRASKLNNHVDVSNDEIQSRRVKVRIQRTDETKGKLALHRHAVLYLNAHNAMMYNLAKQTNHCCYVGHDKLCVLRIHREILDRGDAMLSSQNASTDAVTFFSSTKNPLYSRESTPFLTQPRVEGFDKSGQQIRQAEVLLPYEINPSYIGGIFVSSEDTQNIVQAIINELKEDHLLEGKKQLSINVHSSLFFQGRTRFVSLEPFDPLPSLTDEQQNLLVSELPESDDDLPDYQCRK